MADFTPPLHATEHCRHYSYELGETLLDGGPRCALGIDLTAPGASRICWPSATGTECPNRQEYTEDERKAWDAWSAERMLRLVTAVQALPKAIPLRTGGEIACPSCGGRLRYDRWHRGAAIQCETPDCCGARFNIEAGAEWPARNDSNDELSHG